MLCVIDFWGSMVCGIMVVSLVQRFTGRLNSSTPSMWLPNRLAMFSLGGTRLILLEALKWLLWPLSLIIILSSAFWLALALPRLPGFLFFGVTLSWHFCWVSLVYSDWKPGSCYVCEKFVNELFMVMLLTLLIVAVVVVEEFMADFCSASRFIRCSEWISFASSSSSPLKRFCLAL